MTNRAVVLCVRVKMLGNQPSENIDSYNKWLNVSSDKERAFSTDNCAQLEQLCSIDDRGQTDHVINALPRLRAGLCHRHWHWPSPAPRRTPHRASVQLMT